MCVNNCGIIRRYVSIYTTISGSSLIIKYLTAVYVWLLKRLDERGDPAGLGSRDLLLVHLLADRFRRRLLSVFRLLALLLVRRLPSILPCGTVVGPVALGVGAFGLLAPVDAEGDRVDALWPFGLVVLVGPLRFLLGRVLALCLHLAPSVPVVFGRSVPRAWLRRPAFYTVARINTAT